MMFLELETKQVEALVRHLLHDWIPDETVRDLVRTMIRYLQSEGIEVTVTLEGPKQ